VLADGMSFPACDQATRQRYTIMCTLSSSLDLPVKERVWDTSRCRLGEVMLLEVPLAMCDQLRFPASNPRCLITTHAYSTLAQRLDFLPYLISSILPTQ
jgi:hypothetical protein